jgi:hypothetical protein
MAIFMFSMFRSVQDPPINMRRRRRFQIWTYLLFALIWAWQLCCLGFASFGHGQAISTQWRSIVGFTTLKTVLAGGTSLMFLLLDSRPHILTGITFPNGCPDIFGFLSL